VLPTRKVTKKSPRRAVFERVIVTCAFYVPDSGVIDAVGHKLRRYPASKPVGMKLCVGRPHEFCVER
jgi:hypothetical protein